MRILHITTFLQGGAGRVIASLVCAQKRRGHDVCVVADAEAEPGYGSYAEYLDSLLTAGVPLIEVRSTFKRDVALNASAARALQATLGEWRPDVVHAHAATPAVVARLSRIADGARAPVVHTMHGWGTTKTPAQATADLAILELADAIAAPSRAARKALLDLGLSAPVQVIPYGIEGCSTSEPPDADDAAVLDRLGTVRERAICIGTIGARKNQRLLVEALAQPVLPHATAVFIGDGDSESLLAEARAIGVADRIAVLGYRVRASRYLACGRALVLPSRNEGLPLSVLEAFRARVPVVASRIPELVEALEDEEGDYLFEPDSVTGLATALRTAFDRDDAARAANRAALFRSRYTSDRMVGAYERLYQQSYDARASSPLVPSEKATCVKRAVPARDSRTAGDP
jgi:glycosyltransferase involved in cell wall biosynthesis